MPYWNPDKARQSKREYRQKNREERNAYDKAYRESHSVEIAAYKKEWNSRKKATARKQWSNYQAKVKRDVINAYSDGQMCCACCKEACMDFLTLDHVDGNGAEHRRELKDEGVGWGSSFYIHLRKTGYPNEPKLQVLCYNCNCAKRRLGICPHISPRDDFVSRADQPKQYSKLCLQCNKEYPAFSPGTERRKFCSKKCAGMARRKPFKEPQPIEDHGSDNSEPPERPHGPEEPLP